MYQRIVKNVSLADSDKGVDMFGNSHNNNDDQQADQQQAAPSLPTMGGSGSPFGPQPDPVTPPVVDPPANDEQPQPAPEMTSEPPIPHHEDTQHMVTDHGTPDDAGASQAPQAPSGDLVAIKQQALSQLSPLVSHLDQSPEEKFRTTMMMIQATDDQSLLKEAYDAAGKIEDDKDRAQALLDVINEINYFSQQQK